VIHAYLDESGIHDGAEVCVIAGYFGGPGQFKRFARGWRRELSALGMEMADFHAKDLTARRDHSTVLQLAQLIAQFKIYPITHGIVVKDFFEFDEGQRKFLTGATLDDTGRVRQSGSPNKPYFVPFHHILRRLASYAPVGGKVKFHFGLDRSFAEYARFALKNIQTFPGVGFRERLGSAEFPLASQTAALQAADLLVHLSYDHMLKQERTKNAYLQRGTALRILLSNKRMDDDHVYYDKECIQGHLNQIPIQHRGDTLAEG
jgi:hypothetical protein